MSRVKLKDVTVRRVFEALSRRFSGIFDILAWYVNGYRNSRIDELRGKYSGCECYIVANGPSVNKINMRLLEDKFVIGMNRCYMMEEKWGFLPDILVCINELVLSQFAADFQGVRCRKVFSWSQRSLFPPMDDIEYVNCSLSVTDGFSSDIKKTVYSGGTVTYVCLQLAYYMGFEKVYLIGLDHNFDSKGVPNKTEVREADEDKNHFHPDYFPKGIKWQLPDLLRSELAYSKARSTFESSGREIIDLTVGGKCEVFKKADIRSVLGEGAVLGGAR